MASWSIPPNKADRRQGILYFQVSEIIVIMWLLAAGHSCNYNVSTDGWAVCGATEPRVPPGMAVGLVRATAGINTSVPDGLQLLPRPRRRLACKDLAWYYPGV